MYISRKDPLTDEIFSPKRSNQRFATRKNQIDYNNIKARNKRQKKAPLDKVLDKNRNILANILLEKNALKKSKEFLLGAGFNFKVFNRSIRSNGKNYQCIYEYGVCVEESGLCLIAKIKN